MVRGFENNPDTLGIPTREDWILRIDYLKSSPSEIKFGKVTVKSGGTVKELERLRQHRLKM